MSSVTEKNDIDIMPYKVKDISLAEWAGRK